MFSFTFSLLSALSYVSNLYNYNYMFIIVLYTSVLLSTNNCSVDLYNGDLQTTTIHTQLHTRLTEFLLLLPALSRLFMCAHIQSNKGSWSGTFGVLPFREFFYTTLLFLYTLLSVQQYTCLSLFLSCLLLLVYLELVRCIC